MSDIKLFRLDAIPVVEIMGQSVVVEKTLQTLIEKNLEAFLGVRFLKSEYSTGKTHGGRIDSLGLEITDTSGDELERAKPLVMASYEAN
jgi:hypothetical protein